MNQPTCISFPGIRCKFWGHCGHIDLEFVHKSNFFLKSLCKVNEHKRVFCCDPGAVDWEEKTEH